MQIGGINSPSWLLNRPGSGGTVATGGTTSSGSTSQTGTPVATITTPPSQPPAGSEPVQPTNATAPSGSPTESPAQVGTIANEVRRLETVEAADITKSELIKQPSVAMLAQANLRQQDVLDILNV